MHRWLESVSVARLSHGVQSGRHSFRIAVQATFADLCAASHRVPGAFRPFDPGESQGSLLEYLLRDLDRHGSTPLVRGGETQEIHRAIPGVPQDEWIIGHARKQASKALEKEILDAVEIGVLVNDVLVTEQTGLAR